MGLWDGIRTILPWNRQTITVDYSGLCGHEIAGIYYKKIAIEAAINLIANTLSLANFKTFEKGKATKKDNYYLFNIEPNKNQNANAFWRKTIHNLVYDNEVLIVMDGREIYVADSFTRTTNATRENIYTNVQIESLNIGRAYTESEVLYLTLHNAKMRELIDGMYTDYGLLIEYSKKTYKRSNARRGVVEVPTAFPQTPQAKADLEKLFNEQFKKFFNAEDGALLPLTNGLKYTDLTNQTYKNGSDSRDIRSLVDDVFDYVAVAFQIPPQLLKGAVADSDKSFDNFMTFCLKPWAELIEKEINRKYYGKRAYLEKSYLKIDITTIKEAGLSNLANAIDILTRNGVNTLNDNLRLLGREEIAGELGEQRFLTLNLNTLENITKKGGEADADEEQAGTDRLQA